MERKTGMIILVAVGLIGTTTWLSANHFGRKLCTRKDYSCIKVKRGDTWNTLFPDDRDQNIVKRANRTNARLHAGMKIAVPLNLHRIDLMDISPFPTRIDPPGQKLIIINMQHEAFAAYDEYGFLQHWGPISGGKGWCPDVRRACNTPRGTFKIYTKQGPGCFSTKYPIPNGGSPMPYCMFFKGGYAMHGGVLPGHHASHGCVRLFTEDAQWLNKNFVSTGRSNGTRVIIRSW